MVYRRAPLMVTCALLLMILVACGQDSAVRNSEEQNKALEFGRRGYEMCPMSEDAFQGTLVYEDLAKAYSLAGEPELAIEMVDSLLSIPSHLNLIHVKQDSAFDPLRNHPSYQALISKYEKKYGT